MERVGEKKNGKHQVEKHWKETEIINKLQKWKKCRKTMKWTKQKFVCKQVNVTKGKNKLEIKKQLNEKG
jgi:hypothetical protein